MNIVQTVKITFFLVLVTLWGHSISYGEEDKKFKQSDLTSDRSEGRADKRPLRLTTGEDKIVDLLIEDVHPDPSRAIFTGNPKAVLAQLINVDGKPKQIVFKPLSAGTSTVTVRDKAGKVRIIFNIKVDGTNLLKTKAELTELLKDIEGVQLKILGKKVVVDGEILVPTDYGRLLNVISDKNYSGLVLNLTSLSVLATQILAKKIQDDIKNFASSVTTRVVNGQVWLEGSVESIDQARRAEKVARLYLPDLKPGSPLEKDPTVQRLAPRSLIQNFIVINAPPPRKKEKLVRVTVHFVELSKDYSKVFGFKWEPGFTADPQISVGTNTEGESGAGGTTFTATISSLIPRLQSAQEAGYARILKTGNIVVRSGQPATLSDETLIPFAILGPNGEVTTNTAGVGLTLAVTPLILGQSQDIQLDMDMNQVNLQGRSGNAPITAQHKVQTKLYVKSKESAAIASVVSSDISTQFNKDDPNQGAFRSPTTSPLFRLVRSKSYTKKKSQFVIFVTPQIIQDASDGTKDLKKNFRIKVQ